MLIEKAAPNPERVASLARMLGDAAAQGEGLTRRLLDFARAARDQAALGESNIDETTGIADALSGVCALLTQTIGIGYAIECVIAATGLPDRVRGDRPGLEAVIMNLVINARDAMPHGGKIVVAATGERITPDGQMANPGGFKPGLYARISVADNGTGMSPAVLVRALETFFTTKPRGQGTGLGLAGARAFAERSGGRLLIDSAAGRGTTVTVWLPAAANSEHASKQHEAAS